MPRSDDDTWDITESVGATALGVAAARAAETEGENPLIEDPFARIFLEAAGEGTWSWFSHPSLPDELTKLDPDLPLRMRTMVDYMAARTAFFDGFFLDAADRGVRQAVILASGLDSRAWRLPWPDGVTVYELDQPKVLEFKSAALQERGVEPRSHRVGVAVDLRHDWPAALQQAGFDPSQPTAWSAEGLLPFLPSSGQDLLFERIQDMAAAGSALAVEAMSRDFMNPDRLARQRERMISYRQAVAKMHEQDVPDFEDLWYIEDRADVADWLRHRGWDVSAETAKELMARYGREVSDTVEDAAPSSIFVCARRSSD